MKIVVEIDLHNHTMQDYLDSKNEWHPTGDETQMSVDRTYLPEDPTDDSFVLLKVLEVKE